MEITEEEAASPLTVGAQLTGPSYYILIAGLSIGCCFMVFPEFPRALSMWVLHMISETASKLGILLHWGKTLLFSSIKTVISTSTRCAHCLVAIVYDFLRIVQLSIAIILGINRRLLVWVLSRTTDIWLSLYHNVEDIAREAMFEQS